jgi:hypothetical protein
MAMFKADPAKKLANDLEAARANRDKLTERLAAAEASIAERKTAAKDLARDGADDAQLDRAENELRKAQTRAATLSAALDETKQQIAAFEKNQADLTDKKLRAATAAEIERRAAGLEAVGAAIDALFIKFVEATQSAAEVTLDGKGLAIFAQSARGEIPPAVQMVARELRNRAAATLAGTAPATLPTQPPQLVAPPPPPPSVVCFALRHVAWTDHQGVLRSAGANSGNLELPEAAAKRGLENGAVILMSDPKVKQLARSRAELFVPDPRRCEVLDDSVVPPSTAKTAKHSAFPLPPGEAFEPHPNLRQPYSMSAPRSDVDIKAAATRNADDVEER